MPTLTLAAGTRLGPYEILAPIGAGGMGEVYRALDPRLGRDVAVKVLPASLSKDPDRLRRFEQEAKAAGILNHPNITAVYDVGVQDGAPYVVSELLEGETLRARLARGALSPRKALGHALQIAHGLAAAHEKGIVHRDLKPENLFVTKDGRVKILDFGLAKLTESASGTRSQTDMPTAGTEPGVVLGTLGYMSPEQVRGKPADARSDIFSFGAILYEMLSGKRAFHGDSSADTMGAILMKEPPDLSATNRQIPLGLDRVVRHCLEKDPEQRFHSAHDLAFDLEALSDISVAGPATAARPRARTLKLAASFVLALVALAAAAYLLWPRGRAIDSLAVLPFVNANANANADAASDYLSEGITESLTNSLSQLPNLHVTARTIARRYKGKDSDPQKAGRELGVSAVLSGKVLQRGDTLTIQADLVDVGSGTQLWGDHYSKKMADILTVQEEIATEISEKLRLRLTGEQRKLLTKRSTENTEAYQAYLKGRYYFEHRNEKVVETAIQYFNLAIEKDPAYALAYAGLADCYVVMPSYGQPPKEAYPRARAAATKALELDGSLADPHASLAFIAGFYDWDWPGAEREFKRALELKPSYLATTHLWYGLFLSAISRHDEAIAEMKRAAELDPLAPVIQWNLARILVAARRFDPGIEAGRRAVELGPNAAYAHGQLGLAYLAKGMTAEARSEFQKAPVLGQGSPIGLYFSGGLARCGKRSEAVEILDKLKEMAQKRYVVPFFIAKLYESLGDREETIAWLERAYEDRSWDLAFLSVDPFWDDMRSDPRFRDLLRRLNLAH